MEKLEERIDDLEDSNIVLREFILDKLDGFRTKISSLSDSFSHRQPALSDSLCLRQPALPGSSGFRQSGSGISCSFPFTSTPSKVIHDQLIPYIPTDLDTNEKLSMDDLEDSNTVLREFIIEKLDGFRTKMCSIAKDCDRLSDSFSPQQPALSDSFSIRQPGLLGSCPTAGHISSHLPIYINTH